MYRSILVPLDGSQFSEHALPIALHLARRAGAVLQLLHIYAPLETFSMEGSLFLDSSWERDERERQEAYLQQVQQRLREVAEVPVTLHVVGGEVAGALDAQAAALGSDLIVMTTHARGALARLWLGSVADELLHVSTHPVLLTPPEDGPIDLRREPALHRMLVPLDGSTWAEQMVAPAATLAQVLGAEITLLNVVRALIPMNYTVEGSTLETMAESLIDQIDAAHAQEQQRAQAYLDRIAQQLRGQGLTVQVEVAVEDHPATGILERAGPGQCDLIALATHGRRGLTRLVRGSVADKIIRGAHVPVLVQHPAKGT